MANPLMGYPNRIDEATLSGGSWSASLPLANLQNRRLAVAARAASLLRSATQLAATFGSATRLRLFALVGHNADPNARWRIRAGQEQRTNYALRSDALDNVTWVKSNVAITADQAPSYLDRVTESVAAGAAFSVSQTVGLAPNQTIYVSFEAVSAGRDLVINLANASDSSSLVQATFHVGVGTVASTAVTGNGSGVAASVADLGGGRFRFSFHGKPDTAAGSAVTVTFFLLSGGTPTYTGDGLSGVFLGMVDVSTADGAYVETAAAPASGPALEAYDSGWVDMYPSVYPTDDGPSWEDPDFWTGKPTDEELENQIRVAVYAAPDDVFGKDLRIEIDDMASTAGYLDLGRAFVGPAWQPSRQLMPGSVMAVVHPTLIDAAVNGTESYDPIMAVRAATVTYHLLERDEGLQQAFDLMRRAGVHRELMFVQDPDDAANLYRVSMLCRLDSQPTMDFDLVSNITPQFRLIELVG